MPTKPFGSNNRTTPRRETPTERARRLDKIPAAMAEVMVERESGSGGCTVDDLASAGFTAAEILEYTDDARKLARRSSVREVA